MNFDNVLKHYLPRVWFRFKFIKYKHFGRGEAELALIRHLVEPDSVAVDVGASIGMYAAEMARYARKVLAFEANPAVAAFTRSVVPGNVEVINAALSSGAGRAVLKVPRDDGGHAITEAATIDAGNPVYARDAEAVEIAMHRLDDFAIAGCSFIKVDVEGHEEAVLEGAVALIAAARPVLMLELNESFSPGVVARVAARCAGLSYGGYFFSLGRLRPVADFDPARYQDVALLAVPRRKFPTGREFISNFIYVPDEKRARVMGRLGAAGA